MTTVVPEVHFESMLWKSGRKIRLYSLARFCDTPHSKEFNSAQRAKLRPLAFAISPWGGLL